ncbi:MAG: carboxypeptidase-like regulatory domain-containing protein [Muribaculaceae bacterium]|nr:carboxypeptidase-like regulatory domain-containing protein [Muribaculaceae bacterium]
MKRLLLLASAIWLACAAAVAAPNTQCTGQVVDEANEPLVGATVAAVGTQVVAVTDVDGNFKISVPSGCKQLRVTYIGFKDHEVAVQPSVGVVVMVPDSKVLSDVVVTQSLGKTRETPVAMSTISAQEIEFKLGNQELLEVLKTTPGVYTRSEGGGWGDAKTRMRGFTSENVAMLINGIPVNDMEWGGVYMSNWAGLSEVASSIQTQRGLGATMLSTPSIGGTINITTRTIDVEKGGSVWYGMGNDGMNTIGLKLSTGLMKNGWAVTVLGSRRWGDGYIQGTAFDAYNWFINVTKRINDRHQIGFTAFGAPQWHDQRSYQNGLSVMGWQGVSDWMAGESPYRFNPTFGYRSNGEKFNINHNFYHKPQMALNHIWQINDLSSLSTSVYASITSGGGYTGLGRKVYYVDGSFDDYSSSWFGANNGVLNNQFRSPEGWVDYGKIEEMNAASTTGSNMVVGKQNNAHSTFGLISSYKKIFNFKNGDRIDFTGGLDIRYYVGHHQTKIADLFGGEYYIDNTNRSKVQAFNNAEHNRDNFDWVYEKLHVGDVVDRDYDGFVAQEGAYAQGEYTLLDKRLNLVLSGAINANSYWRKDYYYYDAAHSRSATKTYWGGTIKGGANYNIDAHNNVFFNAGYISRAPFFSYGVFLSAQRSNIVNPDARNEKCYSFELGYGYHSPVLAIDLNGYYTKWLDKTMTKGDQIDPAKAKDGSTYYYFAMSGVDARHMGIELALKYKPVRWFEFDAMFSIADWQWDSNASGYFYNQNGAPLANTNGTIASGILAPDHLWATLNQKGVKVSGSAQTTMSYGVTFRPFKGFRIGADWTAYFRNYSDITLYASNLPQNAVLEPGTPWRIPWGNVLDLNASYRFKLGNLDATVYGNVNNLCNYNYVTQAETGLGKVGTWDNAYRVFYSFGRTYSLKLKVNF